MSREIPRSRPIGFGIVGLGMIAEYHARAISEVPDARLVGVCGRSMAKAREFAERHRVGFATQSLDNLLAVPELDVLCVTTPNGAHLEPALAAIRAGKHLVVEKPLEITLERVDRIIDAANSAGVKLAPIFQSRFGERARILKSAVDAGRFGQLVVCSAYVKWQRKPEYYRDSWHGTAALDGGGVCINQAIHAIDLLQWCAGVPVEVSASVGRCVHKNIEGEDTAVATLRYANGAFGTIEASTAAFPGWSQCIDLCGENGSARLEDDRLVRWEFREVREEDAAIRADSANAGLRSGAAAPNAISHEGHRRQIQDLVHAIRENRAPALSAREARNAVAIIRAIYESAERHAPVTL